MKKTPPRLLARTLTVTFATVAVILTISFIVITLDVRDRVRAAETEKLRVSENIFTALETKRQQDQVAAERIRTFHFARCSCRVHSTACS